MFFRFDQDRGDRGNRIDNWRDDLGPFQWEYDPERGITLTVLIEAHSAVEANAKAESIGISFAPENITPLGLTKEFGRQPTLLYRWMKVSPEQAGFFTIAEALDDSDEYVFFNPWEVDASFIWWPVFVHRFSGNFHAAQAFVQWRSEYDD